MVTTMDLTWPGVVYPSPSQALAVNMATAKNNECVESGENECDMELDEDDLFANKFVFGKSGFPTRKEVSTMNTMTQEILRKRMSTLMENRMNMTSLLTISS